MGGLLWYKRQFSCMIRQADAQTSPLSPDGDYRVITVWRPPRALKLIA